MKYCNADPELWEPHHAGHQCWTVLVPMTEGRGAGTLSYIDWIFYNEQSSGEKVARKYLRPESSSEQHH